MAGGRNRDAERRNFALRCFSPSMVEPARLPAILEHAVAVAQRTVERGDPSRVLAIDGQHDPVEKAAAFGGGPKEKPVHRGREPDDPDMVGKGAGGRHGRAVDPAFAGCAAIDRFQPRAELDLGRSASLSSWTSTETAQPPRAAFAGAIGQFGPAQAAAWRQERQGFEQIGLAGAIMARQGDVGPAGQSEVERRDRSESPTAPAGAPAGGASSSKPAICFAPSHPHRHQHIERRGALVVLHQRRRARDRRASEAPCRCRAAAVMSSR